MRLSNDRDQILIKSAVSDAGASLLTFIPSLGTGEVFAFGAGVALPTRMKFRELPLALRPTSEAGGNTRPPPGTVPDRDLIASVIDRWRAATMSHKAMEDDITADFGSPLIPAMRDDAPSLQPAMPPSYPATPSYPPAAPAPAGYAPPPASPGYDAPHRPSILRKPLTAGPDAPPPPPGPTRWR
jgi:hypothetical protein